MLRTIIEETPILIALALVAATVVLWSAIITRAI